ncbi:hypothetical protein C3L33_22964, partial [Rhododendron williamsianum]
VFRHRDDDDKPKDLPPALPSRPVSRARLLPARRLLPKNFELDAAPATLVSQPSKEEVKGARIGSFVAKRIEICRAIRPESVAEYPLAKPGCQERCGNIDIPYPFGIGSNCSIASGFAVTCDHSSNPPKPIINSINLEVLQISLDESTVKVNRLIFPNCSGRADGQAIHLQETPFKFFDTYNRDYVPTVLDWVQKNETCNMSESFCGANAYCLDNNASSSGSYECFCSKGYEGGNPYLSSGCRGTFSCLGALLLLICMWWLYREVNRRKEAKLKEKFFKRNGGLLLQQQLSSDQGNLETTKLFTSKELEKATDNYNANRILG